MVTPSLFAPPLPIFQEIKALLLFFVSSLDDFAEDAVKAGAALLVWRAARRALGEPSGDPDEKRPTLTRATKRRRASPAATVAVFV